MFFFMCTEAPGYWSFLDTSCVSENTGEIELIRLKNDEHKTIDINC